MWPRPGGGRDLAGAALLGWLADPAAPRLCLVTGGAQCGKSRLLAWLVRHGFRSGTVPERAVHAVAPMDGTRIRAAVWSLSSQLGVTARTAGDLVSALKPDPRRTVIVLPDLHAGVGDPAGFAELVVGLASLKQVRLVVEVRNTNPLFTALRPTAPAVMDLDETQWNDLVQAEPKLDDHDPLQGYISPAPDLDVPASVCSADPLRVTAGYEAAEADHGGLRTAWLRIGQALLQDQPPVERALLLRTALGDAADPRIAPQLADLAAGAEWELFWSRVSGDITPPWPGPVSALALGAGPIEGQVLLSDHLGVLRTVDLATVTPRGRLAEPVKGIIALGVLSDGAVLALNYAGLHVQTPYQTVRTSGLTALLDDGPTPVEQAIEAVDTTLRGSTPTAMAATDERLAVGDADGSVHAIGLDTPDSTVLTQRLHRGAVNSLAAVTLPLGGDRATMVLLYSGGADGCVRAWAPGHEPQEAPVTERPYPVTSLSAAHTTDGPLLAIAWGDGLIGYHRLDSGEAAFLGPGLRANGVMVTADGDLVVGTNEAVFRLAPR
ncbi:hypothetical protein SAMN02745831_04176 [Streptomyces sp. PgraA7]|nr:hypothetical protein SAMN02745831_04176 [Streptomyces sp. PgraA7]